MNYIKQYSDGTTEATLVKPSYGVVSTTGDYLIDGLWYDLTGTLYSPQFTYLSKDGKLLGVEVVDGSPIDIHYDEDAPSIVEKCIQTNTLVLGNQSITGVLGQGQTWQNVTSSRSENITYTNTTGKPIYVSVTGTDAGTSNVIEFYINGIMCGRAAGGVNSPGIRFIVPPLSNYLVNVLYSTASKWFELR